MLNAATKVPSRWFNRLLGVTQTFVVKLEINFKLIAFLFLLFTNNVLSSERDAISLELNFGRLTRLITSPPISLEIVYYSPEYPEECSNCKLNIRQLNLRKFCRRDYGKRLKSLFKALFCY